MFSKEPLIQRKGIVRFVMHSECFIIAPCRPDGEKKAYVRLAPDYDALDVANKGKLVNVNQGPRV